MMTSHVFLDLKKERVTPKLLLLKLKSVGQIQIKNPLKQKDVKEEAKDFGNELSRQDRMFHTKKLTWNDISFESEEHNIFDPFYSSNSEQFQSESSSSSSFFDSVS